MTSQQNNPRFLINSYPYVPVTWFPVGKKKLAESKCNMLKKEGGKMIRVGIDYNSGMSKRKANWYRWMLPTLTDGFEIEPCFIKSPSRNSDLKHTPSLSESVEAFIHCYGEMFSSVGLWRCQQERLTDLSAENIFEQDFVFAISWSKHLGKWVNLCGICPTDFNWILRMISSQVLKNVAMITLDPVDEDLCGYNNSFCRILKSLMEAKGLDIKIHSPFRSDSSDNFDQTGSKSALLNTSWKITG